LDGSFPREGDLSLSERKLFRVIKPNYEVKAVLVVKIPTVIVYNDQEQTEEINNTSYSINEKEIKAPLQEKPEISPYIIEKKIEERMTPFEQNKTEEVKIIVADKKNNQFIKSITSNFEEIISKMNFEMPIYYTREYVLANNLCGKW